MHLRDMGTGRGCCCATAPGPAGIKSGGATPVRCCAGAYDIGRTCFCEACCPLSAALSLAALSLVQVGAPSRRCSAVLCYARLRRCRHAHVSQQGVLAAGGHACVRELTLCRTTRRLSLQAQQSKLETRVRRQVTCGVLGMAGPLNTAIPSFGRIGEAQVLVHAGLHLGHWKLAIPSVDLQPPFVAARWKWSDSDASGVRMFLRSLCWNSSCTTEAAVYVSG